jgi:uncharacterized protein YozE (UPF0346 family)
MSGLSLSHYIIHLTSITTFDDIWLDYLYHTIAYISHLLPPFTTYNWIIFITLWLTSDFYHHVWRLMSGLSLSHYSLYITSTSTFDEIYQDYLYHSIIYIWHLLSHLTAYVWIIFITLYLTSDINNHVWRHMTGLSLSHYIFHLTFTTFFDDIFPNYHTIAPIWNLLPRLTTYIRIIFITV